MEPGKYDSLLQQLQALRAEIKIAQQRGKPSVSWKAFTADAINLTGGFVTLLRDSAASGELPAEFKSWPELEAAYLDSMETVQEALELTPEESIKETYPTTDPMSADQILERISKSADEALTWATGVFAGASGSASGGSDTNGGTGTPASGITATQVALAIAALVILYLLVRRA